LANLSDAARETIVKELRDPALATERLQFDWLEFSKQLAYRSIELDPGAVVTAEAAHFDQVVKRDTVDRCVALIK